MNELSENLGEKLHLAGIALHDMRDLVPAFEAIPYGEALRRCCVGLRAADGMLIVVLGNPFDLDTQDWLEERLREPFGYRLADAADRLKISDVKLGQAALSADCRTADALLSRAVRGAEPIVVH